MSRRRQIMMPAVRALLFRFGLLGVGLVFAQAACSAWAQGNPPAMSLFSPRATARVVAAEVVSGRQNGSLRHTPQVSVLWAGRVTPLRGLMGSFFTARQEAAEAAIRGYTVGDDIQVRIIDGQPYADDNDGFQLFGAVWLSVFAVMLLGLGTVVALNLPWPRRAGAGRDPR